MPYQPRSMNFAHLAGFDELFDRLGYDLECLVHTHPGLAVVRGRQLAEVFATATLDRGNGPLEQYDADGNRIGLHGFLVQLQRNPANTGLVNLLKEIKRTGNQHVHFRSKQQGYEPSVTVALSTLQCAYSAGCWFQKMFGDRNLIPGFRKPITGATLTRPSYDAAPTPPAQRDRFVELEAELDNLEKMVDTIRAPDRDVDDKVKSARQRIESPATRQSLEAWQPAYLDLRLASIDLATHCHRGAQPANDGQIPAKAQAFLNQVLCDPGQTGVDQAILYHNRWAILESNGYLFSRAYDRLGNLVASQHKRIKQTAEMLGVEFVRDEQFGRLLGSLGQLTAMAAWEVAEHSLLDEAAKCFIEAQKHFTHPSDIARQNTYWGHVCTERLRINFPESPHEDDQHRWVEICHRNADDLQAVGDQPFNGSTWHRAFGAALHLKYRYLKQPAPAALQRLAGSISAAAALRLTDAAWRPGNPYEQIVGLLGMHFGGQPPQGLQNLLDRIRSAPSVSGFIGTVYHAQWAFMRGECDRELNALMAGIEDHNAGWPIGMHEDLLNRLRASCRQGEPGPWAILPFNFA